MARLKRRLNYRKGSAGYEREKEAKKLRPVSREMREKAQTKGFEIIEQMQEERQENIVKNHRTGRRFEQDSGGPGINIPPNKIVLNSSPPAFGRPSIYDPLRFPHIAFVLCKERGFTNEELARVFDVSTSTVNQWMWQKKEFKDAVRKGRDGFDSEKVEQALLKRALGYEYVEKHVSRTKLVGKTPQGVEVTVPAVTTTEITKRVVEDPKSIMYWLQNRQPDRWKHTAYLKIETQPEEETDEQEMDIEDMSVEELKALRDMSTKAVELKSKTIDITEPQKRLPTVEEVLAAADQLAEQDRLRGEAEKQSESEIPKRRERC